MSDTKSNQTRKPEGGVSHLTSAEHQERAYNGLSDDERFWVKRAMEYAIREEYWDAISAFASDLNRSSGTPVFTIYQTLLRYIESPEKFEEGLLGFFKIERR
ncbi:uncharacterized protein FPRO_14798 [Fusarium proliferatum ET1]|uniref:Uncharacterized protein n=1 Tax=Fusarium proliferatum (strain ET1) TaxID=1227346 RepID=A0A1L7WAS0_FUSPR|nr:uncharacterized protein FPRO_14798 [Fusarium proliferatum ET1]CZR49725.1 uncharacterized protein FPRO_14798 [Fusarium proliferatum ET1]